MYIPVVYCYKKNQIATTVLTPLVAGNILVKRQKYITDWIITNSVSILFSAYETTHSHIPSVHPNCTLLQLTKALIYSKTFKVQIINYDEVKRKEQLYALLNMQMGPMLKYLNVWFFTNENKVYLLKYTYYLN